MESFFGIYYIIQCSNVRKTTFQIAKIKIHFNISVVEIEDCFPCKVSTKCLQAPPLMEARWYGAINMVMCLIAECSEAERGLVIVT